MQNYSLSVFLIHIISLPTQTSPKVFLAKVEVIASNVSKSGEDYNAGLAREQCRYCPGKCIKESYSIGLTRYRCEQEPTTPTTTTTRPTTTAIAVTTISETGENCVRTPRNTQRNLRAAEKLRKRNQRRKTKQKKKKLMGFWVAKGRQSVKGLSFCCTRGPRKGTMARTPRKCRTPRDSRNT